VSPRIVNDVEKRYFKFSKSVDVLEDTNETLQDGRTAYRLVSCVKGLTIWKQHKMETVCYRYSLRLETACLCVVCLRVNLTCKCKWPIVCA
jgi:hypothetical protein